jgi:hypothetical protein
LYFLKSTIAITIPTKWHQNAALLLPSALALFCLSIPLFGLQFRGQSQGPTLLFANLLVTLSTILVALLTFYLANQLNAKKVYCVLGFFLLYAVYFEVFRQTSDTPKRMTLSSLAMTSIFLWPLLLNGKLFWQQRESVHLRFLSATLLFAMGFWLVRAIYGVITLGYPSTLAYADLFWGPGVRITAAGLHLLLMIIISNRFFELSLMYSHTKAQQNEAQLLSSLNAISLARDNETGQHILRTKTYVKQLALRLRQLGLHPEYLDDQQIEKLYKAAPLHDIGKVGIPDDILHKNGPLTTEEWVVMKTHTTIGETILKITDSATQEKRDVLSVAAEISGGHHERWDGTGYPRGLQGEDIPLAARIMSLADVYDALVSKRVYKAPWSHEDACQEIISKSGTQFDPQVVQAFALEVSAFREIALQFQDPV